MTFEGCQPASSCTFDGGAIELVNNSGSSVTVNSVSVQLNAPGDTTQCVVNMWPSNLSLAAGATLIYAQTSSGTGIACPAGGKFDTSDVGPNASNWAGNCSQSGVIPQVTVTANGVAETLTDSQKVLNTGGTDLGSCPSGTNESEPWTAPGGTAGGLTADQQYGGHNATSPQMASCNQGHSPVDCATGDFWHTFELIAVPGRGIPLDLSLTYNSLAAAQPSVVGFGWAFSYDAGLAVNSTAGTATVTQENGATVPFTLVSGVWQAPSYAPSSLVQNSDGTFTFVRRHGTQTCHFSSSGQLLSITDRNGYVTSLAYNASGQLASVTDPALRTLTFSYGANGDVSQVTDPAGRTVGFGYDGVGNLSSITDVAGGVTSFGYDSAHHLTSMSDPRNDGSLTNTYDSLGRVIQQQDPAGRKTTFGYAAGTTTITSQKGNVTQEHFSNLEPVAITRGYGTSSAATWHYAYDPSTLALALATDPNNNATTYTDDSDGNITSVTDPLGDKTSALYNSFDEPTTATDANGNITTYGYDTKGNRTSVSRTLASTGQTQKTTYTYGDSSHPGDLTAMTDPNLHVWNFTYGSGNGMHASSTDPLGDKTTYTYDCSGGPAAGCYPKIGLLYKRVSPRGNVSGANPALYTTTYTYIAFGEPKSVTDPLGHATTYTYDGDGNLTTLTDPNNHTTGYVYDPDNELQTVNRADGTTLQTGYDGDGNVASQTDGAANPTTYTHDPLERLVSVTDPLNRATSYTYDGAGNLKTMLDPLGRTTTYGYDTANRLTAIGYSDGITPNVSFGYYPDGQRKSMSDGSGTSSHSYDSLERLTSSTNGAGQQVSYGCDLANNETSITYPNGKQLSRGYDNANRFASVTDWLGNKTTFGYDPDSELLSTTFPTATANVDSYAYNNADQLTSIAMSQGSSTLASLTYTRDPLGQLASESQTGLPGAASTSYTYTTLNQLATAGTKSYGYDKADNLTQLDSNTGYVYDKANELTSSPFATFAYDQLGERVSVTATGKSPTGYAYDQAGRLTKFTPNTGAAPTTMAYNGDGLRTSTTTATSTSTFVWDQTASLPLTLSDGQYSYIYGPGNLPIEQLDSQGNPTYLHHDQLGSTRLITSPAGAALATYTFNPYGTPNGKTGTTTTAFRYVGQYTDTATDFQYDRARYYHPGTGQFITRDPLDTITRQAYAYADGNPINSTDPTGFGCGLLDPGGCINDAASGLLSAGGAVAGAAVSISGPVSLVAGGLALIPSPASPLLAGISAVAAGISSANEFVHGNVVAGALDAAGAAFGGSGFVSGLNSSASEAASELARAELSGAGVAAQTNNELAAYRSLAAEYRASRLAAGAYAGSAASLGFDAFGFGLGSEVTNAYGAACSGI